MREALRDVGLEEGRNIAVEWPASAQVCQTAPETRRVQQVVILELFRARRCRVGVSSLQPMSDEERGCTQLIVRPQVFVGPSRGDVSTLGEETGP